jgi:pyruvate/2-oxoglutarate dehydrogenase complex dihydrolipoamide dehydrogenase (E3) component
MPQPGPPKERGASPAASVAPDLQPPDRHNQELLANTHPADWTNPEPRGRYNLVVLGAGTAGLVTAAGAAGLGARVALVERHLMGGDCLNYGCVPSKAVLRSSRVLEEARAAARLGFRGFAPAQADFASVMERMRGIRARISVHDSARRFQSLGVDVFLGEARFSGPDSVAVGDRTLRFRKAVIATGARPARPGIAGLEETGYLTNETVFSLTQLPRRLAVIGGGPVGCELAQAFLRLGSEVDLFHGSSRLLNREDEDAAALLRQSFLREGMRLHLGCRPLRAERVEGCKALVFAGPEGEQRVIVDEILAGAGRVPNVEGLNLEVVGVEVDARRGILVDDALRTTNRRIFAAGDVCSEVKLTHAADASARIVIQNALFLGRKKRSALVVPRCAYTDPEIAQVGVTEREAGESGVPATVFLRRMSEVDRAIADGEEEGFVKIVVRRGTDTILGATIVARHAGEMINEITLAMARGIGLGALAGIIHPYPTQAAAIQQAADAYNRTRLTPKVKTLLSRWLAWSR